MKFQKMIRVPMMLMGLGAGLLLAKPVCAQQEVDPSYFETASDSSSQYQSAAQSAPSYEAAPAMAANEAAPLAAQEVEAAQLSAADATVTAILMLGIGSIVLFGMAEAVRGGRRRTWKTRMVNGFPASATGN